MASGKPRTASSLAAESITNDYAGFRQSYQSAASVYSHAPGSEMSTDPRISYQHQPRRDKGAKNTASWLDESLEELNPSGWPQKNLAVHHNLNQISEEDDELQSRASSGPGNLLSGQPSNIQRNFSIGQASTTSDSAIPSYYGGSDGAQFYETYGTAHVPQVRGGSNERFPIDDLQSRQASFADTPDNNMYDSETKVSAAAPARYGENTFAPTAYGAPAYTPGNYDQPWNGSYTAKYGAFGALPNYSAPSGSASKPREKDPYVPSRSTSVLSEASTVRPESRTNTQQQQPSFWANYKGTGAGQTAGVPNTTRAGGGDYAAKTGAGYGVADTSAAVADERGRSRQDSHWNDPYRTESAGSNYVTRSRSSSLGTDRSFFGNDKSYFDSSYDSPYAKPQAAYLPQSSSHKTFPVQFGEDPHNFDTVQLEKREPMWTPDSSAQHGVPKWKTAAKKYWWAIALLCILIIGGIVVAIVLPLYFTGNLGNIQPSSAGGGSSAGSTSGGSSTNPSDIYDRVYRTSHRKRFHRVF